VIASYFEWVQDLQYFFWSEKEIENRLERIIVDAFHAVMNKAEQRGIGTRMAAQILGIERVARATELRGIYP
jgi:glutamate dehydrogenase (NAD(P)+)